jgi:hypothetical protein
MKIGRLQTFLDAPPMSGVKGLRWSIDFGSLKIGPEVSQWC